MTTLVNGPERRVDAGWCMEAATTEKGLQVETPKPQLSRQRSQQVSSLPNEVCRSPALFLRCGRCCRAVPRKKYSRLQRPGVLRCLGRASSDYL